MAQLLGDDYYGYAHVAPDGGEQCEYFTQGVPVDVCFQPMYPSCTACGGLFAGCYLHQPFPSQPERWCDACALRAVLQRSERDVVSPPQAPAAAVQSQAPASVVSPPQRCSFCQVVSHRPQVVGQQVLCSECFASYEQQMQFAERDVVSPPRAPATAVQSQVLASATPSLVEDDDSDDDDEIPVAPPPAGARRVVPRRRGRFDVDLSWIDHRHGFPPGDPMHIPHLGPALLEHHMSSRSRGHPQ